MRKNKTCGIYYIKNTANNKLYIGQSICIEDRWCKHKGALRRGVHDNILLQKDWDKYGSDCFKLVVIEKCNKDQLDEKEKYYIKKYNSLDNANGYNMTFGGKKSGIKFTDLSNKRLGEAIKKVYIENPNAREERRQAALNQWANPEIKKKIMGKNNGMYGRTHTKEAREKISNAAKGRISFRRNTTPVLCIELNKTFSCAAVAAKELNIHPSILEVCKGNRKTCGGYHWKFVKENNI